MTRLAKPKSRKYLKIFLDIFNLLAWLTYSLIAIIIITESNIIKQYNKAI